MKKTRLLVLAVISFFILSSNSFAQNVEVSNGGPVTSYATLADAFTAINTGAFTGAITVNIVGNTTETVTATLDSSGNGTGSSYTSITIQPSGGASRTITGAFIGHLINLNGADNVTIDGLNTGGNSLSISNTALGASSAIRFILDAKNNTVTNCTITGSTVSTTVGVIFFSTGSASGNDNNTISNNTISAAGSNLPQNCILSSGTSTAVDNSGNTISGNNISDFFNASGATSGIFLSTANSGWTVSNNKLFQTANRTYTSANTHTAIAISTGSGYTITGNTIGYATSGGTGTYTMLGTIATRFVGIGITAATTTAVTSVQGNTVTAISLNTSSGASTINGVLCGINILGATNANVGNITPNVIGGSSGTGLLSAIPSTTQGTIVGINSSSTGTVAIQNNVIGGLTSASPTASIAGGIIGINCSGIAASITITGNTIGNSTSENMRAGATGLTTGNSLASGISMTSTPVLCTISNNTIQNIVSYGTLTAGFARGIFTGSATGSTSVFTISGNTITNISSNSALATISNGFASVNGIVLAVGNASTISDNTISNLSNTNASTGGYIVAGISIGNGTNVSVKRNIIYNLSNASTSVSTTAPGIAAGIVVRSGTTSDTVANNMITLGAGQTTNTSFIGIMCNHGSTPDPVNLIYYNTVSISGTASSGAQPSMGFYRGDFSVTTRTQTTIVKNNVFDNARTGGTGKHYAIANNYGATTSATGWSAGSSDNNVLNSASSSTVGYWTTDQDFAGWKSASACDFSSVTAVPITYTNAATGNLRFNMGVTPTQLESGSIVLTGITTDIDGFARPKPAPVNGGGTFPDFGASESDMVPLDLTGPNISYGLIPAGVVSANRTLTGFATITDNTGVNVTPGTRPRVYYKKSTDANAFVGNTSGDNGWKWVEASNASSPFNFTIDYTIINGGSISVADVIQYFVVAQDLSVTPNVSSNPNLGFTGTTVAAITSAPTTPNSYTIGTTFPSVVYLGTGAGVPNYPSFSGAAGLFNAINTSVVASDVTVIVQNNTVEDGTVSLNQFSQGYRIVVVPGAASVFTFEGTTAAANDPLLEFNGADDFLIDGRFGGSGKYLRFVNNSATASSTGPILRFVNDSRRSGIGYCTLESNASTFTNAMIMFSTTTGNYGNDSLLVDSCLFKNSTGTNPGAYFTAIGSTGTSVGNQKNNSIAIINNNFTGWLASSTAIIDLSAGSMGDSLVVDSNRVYNNITMTGSTWTAIKLTGNGNNCTANFNSIGGSNPDRSGSPIFANVGITMIGIDVKSGNTIKSDVHGNIIANISNMAPGSTTSGITKGINVQGGRLNIGTLVGNTIGGKANPWDTVTTGYDNGWIDVITASATDSILIWNNTVSYANYWRKRNDRNAGINIAGTSGAYIDVYNNNVNNMKGNGTGNSTSFQNFGIRLANTGANTVINARNNNINTMLHTCDTVLTGNIHEPVGIIFASGVATQTVNIYNNKIYDIQSNANSAVDTGSTAPIVSGIKLFSATSTLNVYNNSISLATQNGTQTRVIGIYQGGTSTTNPCNISYNSVYLGGTATGSTANVVSYGFVRINGLITLRNNIFYNGRTGGGRNLAIANQSAVNWTSTSSDYNLLVSTNASQCGEYTSSLTIDFATWKTNSGGDGYSSYGTTATIPAASLFTSTATADLSLVAAQQVAWYASGQGTPLLSPSISTDILGGARSTTVAGGSTDIGAYNVIPATAPPTATESAAPAPSTTTTYSIGGKTLASINWGPGGTPPSSMSLVYYPGTNPPNSTGFNVGNGYWSFTATGGSGYTYDIVLYYDPAQTGTIPADTNVVISKSDDGGTTYNPYTTYGTGAGQYQRNSAANYITVYGLTSFSIFALSDSDLPLPVELVAFTSSVNRDEVKLNWSTSMEKNNSGFEIERKPLGSNTWTKAGSVQGRGTTNELTNYTFSERGLATGKYNYRLRQLDFNGNSQYFSLSNEVNVGVPMKFDLSQNYPNPFNPSTKINFDLPFDSKVQIKVFDITGREMTQLVNETKTAGYHTVQFNASNMASGVYFYMISANGGNQSFVKTMKMVLVK
ncbi:MAG: T9SS type A sorting domain-containing protein [Ignavibacteria bacterium]|nr:T9SS type A sorting domain-containing protein [Ignavibacteria bacterium]